MQGSVMFKALCAWAGVMAVRAPIQRSVHRVSQLAHDAANREQALFAGSQAIIRRAARLSDTMEARPGDTAGISAGVDELRRIAEQQEQVRRNGEIRPALDELARRLD